MSLGFWNRIDTSERIHQLHKGVKIDPDIVVDLDSIEILKRSHRSVYSIDTCVGQLVSLVSGYAGNLHKVLSRRCGQLDGMGPRVDCHNDIDVTSAGRIDGTAHVYTADQDIVGIFSVGNLLANRCISALSAFDHSMNRGFKLLLIDDPGIG